MTRFTNYIALFIVAGVLLFSTVLPGIVSAQNQGINVPISGPGFPGFGLGGGKVTFISPGSEVKVGKYKLFIEDYGVSNISYSNKPLISEVSLGPFLAGVYFDKLLEVVYKDGALIIQRDALTILMKNGTVVFDENVKIFRIGADILIKLDDKELFIATISRSLVLENNTISGSGGISIRPAYGLIDRMITYLKVKYEISDKGIENITVKDVKLGSLIFSSTNFIGSLGKIRAVYFWNDAKAYVVPTREGMLFDVYAGNITFVPEEGVEINLVTPTMAILVVNNETYGLISGKIELEDGTIKAEKFLRLIVEDKILERLVMERHRYHFRFGINATGEFFGRYISGVLENGIIYNYTVRGILIAYEVDLSELLSSGYGIVKRGHTINIVSGDNRIKIVDSAPGPVIIKSKTGGQFTVKLPEEYNIIDELVNTTLTGNCTSLKIDVNGTTIILNVYNGTIEIQEGLLLITLYEEGVAVLLCPPQGLSDRVPNAFVKVFSTGEINASGESIRPDINVNTQVEGKKIIARISGEGEGTLVDIEIDPSADISIDDLDDLSVRFDGVELQQKSLDEILSGDMGYAITFDGVSYHVIIPIEHFSEHTIEVSLEAEQTSTLTPTPTPEEEGVNISLVVGIAIAAIAVVGIAAFLATRKR